MDQKKLFVKTWLRRELAMTDLCRSFGITPKTGYKWLERFAEHGEVGLKELSRARHFHPNATPDAVVVALLEMRRRYRHGLVMPRKRRDRMAPPATPLSHATHPNAVWAADFKGHFAMGDKRRCYPLTITDAFSRYLIRCDAYLRADYHVVRRSFERAFVEYGLPAAIRTDNGPPFASLALGGISRLGVWFVKLGIRPERIQPGKPQQNGRHERFHRTLKLETQPRRDRLDQQTGFDQFKLYYNLHRPHEALGQKPPQTAYQPSQRAYPCMERDPEYPADYEVARVRTDGALRWGRREYHLCDLLAGERVGLLRQEDGSWLVDFGPYRLGMLTTDGRLRRSKPKAKTRTGRYR